MREREREKERPKITYLCAFARIVLTLMKFEKGLSQKDQKYTEDIH